MHDRAWRIVPHPQMAAHAPLDRRVWPQEPPGARAERLSHSDPSWRPVALPRLHASHARPCSVLMARGGWEGPGWLVGAAAGPRRTGDALLRHGQRRGYRLRHARGRDRGNQQPLLRLAPRPGLLQLSARRGLARLRDSRLTLPDAPAADDGWRARLAHPRAR